MSMFGPRMGDWGVHSKEDPRWNQSGRGSGWAMCGGPKEMQDWLDWCKEKYGDKPKDLRTYFMKD